MWSRWVRWRGLLVCAIDGTIMTVADTAANLAVFTKQRGGATGGSSYPMLRLVALVCCGTRRRGDGAPASASETSAPAIATVFRDSPREAERDMAARA